MKVKWVHLYRQRIVSPLIANRPQHENRPGEQVAAWPGEEVVLLQLQNACLVSFSAVFLAGSDRKAGVGLGLHCAPGSLPVTLFCHCSFWWVLLEMKQIILRNSCLSCFQRGSLWAQEGDSSECL